MKLSHVALWTDRLEELREFYCRYFGGRSNEKYVNPAKAFESYFIAFDGGVSLELMRKAGIDEAPRQVYLGLCHMAFELPDREAVVELTERLRADGCKIAGEPRVTGDGFFESVIADPEGNLVELTAV